MLLHHCLYRVMILAMIVNILSIFENKRPVRIQAVFLDGVFHVICPGLVKSGALDIVCNAGLGQFELRSRGLLQGRPEKICAPGKAHGKHTYISYFFPKP